MDEQEIHGTVKQMRGFIENNLGFDSLDTCEIHFNGSRATIHINANDKFQSKRDYYERIGRLHVWETGDTAEEIIAITWKHLNRHMRRDERELRFTLTTLGDAIEGDQFNTEIGKMIALRMKSLREDISEKYLPAYQIREENA